jgi:hypothetical protein
MQGLKAGSRMQAGRAAAAPRPGVAAAPRLSMAGSSRRRAHRPRAAGNGAAASCPSPAETARTLMDLASEGTLSAVCADGLPIGTPVSFVLEKDGTPLLQVPPGCLELLGAMSSGGEARCSLLVQPTSQPARSVAAVALSGVVQLAAGLEGQPQYRLKIDKCIYFGGLDNVRRRRRCAAPPPPALQIRAAPPLASLSSPQARRPPLPP